MINLTIPMLRVLLATGMLTYAAYEDVRTREVHDLVWIIFGIPGIILALFQMNQGILGWSAFLLSLSVSLIFSAFSLFAHLFGEADLLALITLTIIHPIQPRMLEPLWIPGIIFPLTVLTNSALLGASSALFFLIKNISMKLNGNLLFRNYEAESLIKKLTLLFTGSRIKVKNVRGPPFQYPLETLGENGKKTLLIRPNINDDQEAKKFFENLNQAGIDYTWVSNTLPFLFIIFLGYFASIFLGDIILSVLFSFVRA